MLPYFLKHLFKRLCVSYIACILNWCTQIWNSLYMVHFACPNGYCGRYRRSRKEVVHNFFEKWSKLSLHSCYNLFLCYILVGLVEPLNIVHIQTHNAINDVAILIKFLHKLNITFVYEHSDTMILTKMYSKSLKVRCDNNTILRE